MVSVTEMHVVKMKRINFVVYKVIKNNILSDSRVIVMTCKEQFFILFVSVHDKFGYFANYR